MMPFLLSCAPPGLASIAAWCGSGTTTSGSAVVTCLNATARTRRAERAIQSDVLPIWQVLHGAPSVPCISAQRGAQFDDHCTSNLFINNKLRQRYSKYKFCQGMTSWRASYSLIPSLMCTFGGKVSKGFATARMVVMKWTRLLCGAASISHNDFGVRCHHVTAGDESHETSDERTRDRHCKARVARGGNG